MMHILLQVQAKKHVCLTKPGLDGNFDFYAEK